jgi:uncharacterized protein (UPF0261 family)
MAATPKIVYAIATMDTKGREIEFVAEILANSEAICQAGLTVRTIDVSTTRPSELFGLDLTGLDRSIAIELMSQALAEFLTKQSQSGQLAGAIGLGGSGGTALIAPALRALPIGVPKLIVSTVASGNTAPYVGCSDLVLFPSVVDVSGLNAVSTRILANAANALVGMLSGTRPELTTRRALAMTMFGVTTPCVSAVRQALEDRGYDCLVFHATGVGGQAMEGLVQSGLVQGVLDLTTTEVADEVVGGVFPAGPKRFDSLAQRNLPCVLSVGAMDMVNFGAIGTVPEPFRNRKLHIHNSNVTLMRTTPEENRRCADWMALKLTRSLGPVRVLLPLGGISALDSPGKPFYDPEADEALFERLEESCRGFANIRIERVDAHINDQKFVERVLATFDELAT